MVSLLLMQIQGPTLRTIANLAESDEMAKNLIKCGITPKNITLITIFYQVIRLHFIVGGFGARLT